MILSISNFDSKFVFYNSCARICDMSDTSDWWNIFTDSRVAGTIFRASPDPLLDLPANLPSINLYKAGPIFPSCNSPKLPKPQTQSELATSNPRFAKAWNAHPSQYLRRQQTHQNSFEQSIQSHTNSENFRDSAEE